MATNNSSESEILLMEEQAARILKVSPRTLQNWRVRGIGPSFIRAGRMIRYRPLDLTNWLQLKTVSYSVGVRA